MSDEEDTLDRRSARARTLLIVTVAGSLPAFEIGFEAAAFETFSYRRVLAVFVASTVVLAWTFFAPVHDRVTQSWWSRLMLALPAVYLVADATLLTDAPGVAVALVFAVIATFPWVVYVVGRSLAPDYFALSRSEQVVAAAIVVMIAAAGAYIGTNQDRFLLCSDFERIGDFRPETCTP